jgi:lipoprotein-anchoring transpeptidase ErfK/SrfK
MLMQIMLDRANFSPGCIDGRLGGQSQLALRTWQRIEGLPVSGELDDAVRARLPNEADAFTSYAISSQDTERLSPVPQSWKARAAASELGYATVLESLSERFHLTQRALKELNPAVAWPDPAIGTVLRVPNVAKHPRVLASRLEIHLAGKYMQVFDYEGKLVAHFPCSIARDKAKRPVGDLHIANAAENPNYTFRPELFAEDPEAASIRQSLVIPPGPNNPVGVAWMSLDRPGYGIHGTPHPEDIGRTESHGCFRLANWNARKLLGMVSIGIPVLVVE